MTLRTSLFALLGTLALAQPAIAQSITCEELKELQDLGLKGFDDIDGGEDEFGTRTSTYQLAGASECYLDFKSTTYPSFNCVWRNLPSQQSAEAARLALKDQVLACLPKDYKVRERAHDNKYGYGFSSIYRFGDFQPTITIGRSTDKKYNKHSVRFTFSMDLPED